MYVAVITKNVSLALLQNIDCYHLMSLLNYAEYPVDYEVLNYMKTWILLVQTKQYNSIYLRSLTLSWLKYFLRHNHECHTMFYEVDYLFLNNYSSIYLLNVSCLLAAYSEL